MIQSIHFRKLLSKSLVNVMINKNPTYLQGISNMKIISPYRFIFLFLQITFFFFFCLRTYVLLAYSHTYVLLASDFHELWHKVMTISLLTEVKQQWSMLLLGWVTVSVWNQLWDVSKLEFLCVTRFRKF